MGEWVGKRKKRERWVIDAGWSSSGRGSPYPAAALVWALILVLAGLVWFLVSLLPASEQPPI